MTQQAIDAIVAPFLGDCDTALGMGYSAVLFGSAARGDWVAGESDVNLLLVADLLGPEQLAALRPAFDRLRPFSAEAPLLLSRAEWAEADDAFPLEITDMRLAYRVLRGSDPLAAVEVARPELRRALEREWRGKLLQLRRGFVSLAGDETSLGALASQSTGSMLVLYRTTLVLLGEAPPADPVALAVAAARRLGLDGDLLGTMAGRRRGAPVAIRREQFAAYLGAVERAVAVIDQYDTGEGA